MAKWQFSILQTLSPRFRRRPEAPGASVEDLGRLERKLYQLTASVGSSLVGLVSGWGVTASV